MCVYTFQDNDTEMYKHTLNKTALIYKNTYLNT